MSDDQSLALRLAGFATETKPSTIPSVALERAKMSLASTVASTAMGQNIASARIIRDLDLANGGTPDATIWFVGKKLPVAAAARVNAVASDAAASDDSDLRSIAHIGTIVSTTSVALGEKLGSGGLDILAAMVVGYEIAGRIDEALTPGRMQRGFHGSVSTVFGGTVAAGRLLGLSTQQMAHAIALAATSIGGMAISADTSCGREYHAGCSAAAGLQAALAAQAGFEGELGVLDKPRGFLSAMGGQALEAASDAARLGHVDPNEVEAITISSSVQWTKFKGEPHPRNLVDAAHSLYYFVAASIVDGRFSWEHMDPQKMADPVIAALQDKVAFDPNPAPLPDRFPHRHGGTVIIKMKNGEEYRSTCKAPRGSGPRGVEWSDVEAKYRALVPLCGLPGQRIEASLALIRGFESGHPSARLTSLISLA